MMYWPGAMFENSNAPSSPRRAPTEMPAIRGRTNQGVHTIPLGTYVIEWTMMDGQWKISTLGGTFGRKPSDK
jgi:hypothetical protein